MVTKGSRLPASSALVRFLMSTGACAVITATALAQPTEPAPGLSITAVEITPEQPGVDTLCQLRVQVRNEGDKPAYQLGFEVSVGGHALGVYDKQLWLQAIPPGETTEVRLFNFWTTETGRERPADGRLEVEVVLREAQWLTVSTETTEEDDGEPVEVWTPAGAVGGLPVRQATMIELDQ